MAEKITWVCHGCQYSSTDLATIREHLKAHQSIGCKLNVALPLVGTIEDSHGRVVDGHQAPGVKSLVVA